MLKPVPICGFQAGFFGSLGVRRLGILPGGEIGQLGNKERVSNIGGGVPYILRGF